MEKYLGVVPAARKFGITDLKESTIIQSMSNLRRGVGSVSPQVRDMPEPDVCIEQANGALILGWKE